MEMEVCCGQCGGRLLIETPGVVVACPHCGAHLSIPDSQTTASVSDVPPAAESPLGMAVVPSSPAQSDSSIFQGADVESGSQSSAEVGWGSNPKLSLGSSKITGGVTESESVATIEPTKPAANDVSTSSNDVPPIGKDAATHDIVHESSPTESQISPTGDAPDFSWMHQPSAATPVANPSLDFTGTVPVVGTVPTSGFGEATGLPEFPVNFGVSESALPSGTLDIPATPVLSEASTFDPSPWAGLKLSTGDTIGEEQSTAFGPTASLAVPGSGTSPNSPEIALPSDAPSSAARQSDLRLAVAPARPANSSLAFIILGSYASLITIYAAYLTFFQRTHQLESLPDLKTVQQQGGRASVPRPENRLPPGHELQLGQSQRFGNIRVTPLRVTRGPIRFAHYKGDAAPGNRSPSEPVLKLWLKLENVSNDQAIVPLDTTLMFFHRMLNDRVISYNVIFRDEDRKKRDARTYTLFDGLAENSEWTMVGQHTNEELAPGQSFETFVPSEEDTHGLTGPVTWRVHLRKGYGPETGNGVTTLFDVRFNSDEIQPETS